MSILDPTFYNETGIAFILALQTYATPLLNGFARLISEFGGAGLLAVLPLLLWCVEPRLGLRTLLALALITYLTVLLKDIVQAPRPFLIDANIVHPEHDGFSFPSGHAARSIVVYGMLALWVKPIWLKALLVALIALIGLTRPYLGLHYPHDVLGSWLLGILVLWVTVQWGAALAQAFYRHSYRWQITIAFIVPTFIACIHYWLFSTSDAWLVAGASVALLLCVAREQRQPLLLTTNYTHHPIGLLIRRYVVGIALVGATVIVTWLLFKMAGSYTSSWLRNIWVWCNGFVVLWMITRGAPVVFRACLAKN
jgi:membrane-associated phospholipid phosphatase